MKSKEEIALRLSALEATRKEVADSYRLLSKEDVDDWRGAVLEKKWERADAGISELRWALNESTK